MTAFRPERGGARVVDGWAFTYRLRCRLVMVWDERAPQPWFLLTDLPASQVDGAGFSDAQAWGVGVASDAGERACVSGGVGVCSGTAASPTTPNRASARPNEMPVNCL